MDGEVWQSLSEQGFPGYSVSNWGRVLNERYQRIIALSKNQQGFVKVAISDRDYNRITVQVNRLVARAFMDGESETFNNLIHLNGNKDHTFVDNLAWRPRWFALKYHAQFVDREPFVPEPIMDVDTGEQFDDSRQAAKRYGLLEKDIFRSTCMPDIRVPPTGQRFRIISED